MSEYLWPIHCLLTNQMTNSYWRIPVDVYLWTNNCERIFGRIFIQVHIQIPVQVYIQIHILDFFWIFIQMSIQVSIQFYIQFHIQDSFEFSFRCTFGFFFFSPNAVRFTFRISFGCLFKYIFSFQFKFRINFTFKISFRFHSDVYSIYYYNICNSIRDVPRVFFIHINNCNNIRVNIICISFRIVVFIKIG